MAKVISCAHEKGGVGKTTTTVSLGIGLAREGKKVLLLDADPQGDLTKCLGVKDPKELRHTIASCMDYLIHHEDEDFYPDLEYHAPILHHKEGVDFIPANASLAATEVALVNSMSRETVMRQYGKSMGQHGNYTTNTSLSGRELLMTDEVRMLDNRKAILFIRGEYGVMDEKYDILKHPNIALTVDGGAPPYIHGQAPKAIDPESIYLIGEDSDYEVFSETELQEIYEMEDNQP